MSKDIYGTELNPGDDVAYITTGYGHRVTFAKGVFLGVHKNGGYQIETTNEWTKNKYKTTLQCNRVIKINPIPPKWRWEGTSETSYSR